MLRLIDVACSQPWLIQEPWLATIIDIINRDNESIDVVEARLGRKLDNTQTVTNRDGVAIIPVVGPIVRYADIFREVSGATSIQTLARDFQAAVDDPSIRSIILNIDSPGGQVSGIAEMAAMIAAAPKPVTAYVGNMAASGAYWLASAADQIVMNETATVGSIGAVIAVRDPSADKVKPIEIVSAQSPKKRLDVMTETGRAELQRLADETAAVFIDQVAQYRGVSVDQVMSDFGQGGMRLGADAITHGMADRLGSLEAMVADMKRMPMGTPRPKRMQMKAAAEGIEMNVLEEIKKLIMGEPSEPAAVEETPTPEAATPDTEPIDATAIAAELADAKAELARLKAEADAALKEEHDTRCNAETESFLAKYEDRMGKELRETMEAQYRAAKMADNDALVASLEAVAEKLPPLPSGRIEAGGAAVEAKIDAVTGASEKTFDVVMHDKVVAFLQTDEGKGLTYREAYNRLK